MQILEAVPNLSDEFSSDLAGSPRSHVGTPTRIVPPRAPWTQEAGLVFLVGCPRSGTTWLQAMLACHPEIYTGPETQFFGAYHPVEREYLREKDGRCGISEYLSPEERRTVEGMAVDVLRELGYGV